MTTAAEALDKYLGRTLQLVVVDRGILASDLDLWQARRAGDRTRELPLIVTSMVELPL